MEFNRCIRLFEPKVVKIKQPLNNAVKRLPVLQRLQLDVCLLVVFPVSVTFCVTVLLLAGFKETDLGQLRQ